MTPVQITVTLAGVALAVAVNVWFFAAGRPRKAGGASGDPRGSGSTGAGHHGAALVMPGEGRPAPRARKG
jgi:hypothetical protein